MIWSIISTVATLISAFAYVITIYYLRNQLRSLEKDRYLNVTSQLYSIWQSKEFMEDQLWLVHHLKERTWAEFIAVHRAERGEVAFQRIGSFYDRVGTLVRMGIINDKEILSTMGGHAIAVWTKIQPLVLDARKIEHSTLFDDFEVLLPSCYECYVPSLGKPAAGAKARTPHSAADTDIQVKKVDIREVSARIQRGDRLTLLDSRQPAQFAREPATLPGAIAIPPDSISTRYGELPRDRDVVVFCA